MTHIEFAVNSKNLLSAVSLAEKCMKGKILIPIVNNFLFSMSSDGKLTVFGTNLQVSGSASVQTSDHNGEGQFLIDSKKISVLLKTFSDQPLNFTVLQDDTKCNVTISSSDGKYEIVSAGALAEYPTPRDMGAEHAATMDKGAFLYCMNAVSPFAAPEGDLRDILVCVHVRIRSGVAEFAATDARICCYVSAKVNCDEDGDFTIPTVSANAIRQALRDGEGDVTLCWSEDQTGANGFVSVSEQGAKITTRPVDSAQTYPNYRGVYPTDIAYSASLNKADMALKLKRLMVCSDSLAFTLKMYFDGNTIRMTFDGNMDNGISGAESISPSNVGTYAGAEPMEVGVDVRQLLRLVENTSGEDFKLDVESPTKPITISDTDEDGVRQIVMPLYLN